MQRPLLPTDDEMDQFLEQNLPVWIDRMGLCGDRTALMNFAIDVARALGVVADRRKREGITDDE